MHHIILLSVFISLFACNGTKEIGGADVLSIKFGTGGGFTGEVTTYEISSDGHLNLLGQNTNKFIKKINKQDVHQIFDEAFVLKTYKFNEPGNIYSFLEILSKDTTNRITWGVGSTTLSTDVSKLYDKLISLTK